MKAREIKNTYEVLNKMSDNKMPYRMGLILAQNKRKIAGLYADINASLNKLLMQYAEKNENGEIVIDESSGSIVLRKKDSEEYWKEQRILLDTDFDVSFSKISLEDIEKCDQETRYDALTFEEIYELAEMIEEE